MKFGVDFLTSFCNINRRSYISTEASHRSINEPPSIPKQRRSREDSDEVEVYEELSDEDNKDGKPAARKASSATKSQESNDDEIFQMDDLEDGEGVAVGVEGGKSTGKDQEITTLENKMKNLNVMSKGGDSQNSKTKAPIENSSRSSFNNGSSNHQEKSKANQLQKPIIYGFKSAILSGGKRPEVQCQVCKKDGHMSNRCPDLRKPTLKPLPPFNPGMDNLVSAVCARARGKMQGRYERKFIFNIFSS